MRVVLAIVFLASGVGSQRWNPRPNTYPNNNYASSSTSNNNYGLSSRQLRDFNRFYRQPIPLSITGVHTIIPTTRFVVVEESEGAACPPLAIPNAVYDPTIASANSIAPGGRVRISCGPGYENSGAEWVVCGKGGAWKTAAWSRDAAPACHASCNPPNITNAVFNPSIAGSGLTRHGSRVEVGCAEGFEFVGDKVIECYHGTFTGVTGAKCFMSNESFCRDDNLTPLIQGALAQYPEDPLKATQAINKFVLMFRGIRANGLSYIGLTPSAQYKPFETNAFYIPGITGSDATYQSLVIPMAWNVTTLPEHLQMQNIFCRVYDEENGLTAYVLKVLYRNDWGRFSLGQKK